MDHHLFQDGDLSKEHRILTLRSRQCITPGKESLTIPHETIIPCEQHCNTSTVQPDCINCVQISLYNQLPFGM